LRREARSRLSASSNNTRPPAQSGTYHMTVSHQLIIYLEGYPTEASITNIARNGHLPLKTLQEHLPRLLSLTGFLYGSFGASLLNTKPLPSSCKPQFSRNFAKCGLLSGAAYKWNNLFLKYSLIYFKVVKADMQARLTIQRLW